MFGSIFTDTEKRLWLEINAHQEGSGRFDLFSESGDYLGSIDFPENARRAEFIGESDVLFSFPASNPENYSLKLYSIGM